MKTEVEKTCVVCFKLLDECSKCEVLNKATLDMLEVIFMKSVIDVPIEYLVCSDCITNIKNFFSFKSICLETEDNLIPYFSPDKSNKLDIKVLLLNEENSLEKFDPGAVEICRLCRRVNSSANSVMKVLVGDLRGLFERHIPEVDLQATMDPVICGICQLYLESFSKFVKKSSGFNYMFLEDHIIPTDDTNGDDIKSVLITPADVHDLQSDLSTDVGSHINKDNLEKKQPRKRTKAIKICDICSFATKSLYSHRLVHLNPAESEMFKCTKCPFKTKRAQSLDKHMTTHEAVDESRLHKCQKCIFQTKYIISFKRHMTIHQTMSEAEMFKCESCNYRAKRLDHLKKHMLIHMDPSELKWHECRHCLYKTIRAQNFKLHMKTHQREGELKEHRCTLCNFQTRFSNHLRRHMKYHQKTENSEEIQ